MQAKLRPSQRAALAAVAATLLLPGLAVALAPAASAAPPLPSTACTSSGGTATCDLWARAGTVSLPTQAGTTPVTTWGYSSTVGGPAEAPGPALVLTQGDTVSVTLHNDLAAGTMTSLAFPGMAGLASDTVGTAFGTAKPYTFTAGRPGTFVYQAGLTTDGARQVAMGMVGALIVRPAAANQAYGPSSAFDDEALLVMTEIDPGLNASPGTYDLRNYSPRYRLLNGKVYPTTDPIPTAAGRKVLLRYVNAGVVSHSIGVLGMHQKVLTNDGHPLARTYRAVAETIPPGQTLDTIVTVPAAPVGTKYALYEAANKLSNAGVKAGATQQLAFGGMLTFLTTGVSAPPTGGPTTTNAALSPPGRTTGSAPVTVTANVSDVATGNSNIAAAELFIDSQLAAGSGTAMTGTFTSPTVNVSGTITTAMLASLPTGNHAVYVHGKDAAGNWGPFASVVLLLDKSGPVTSAVVLTPNATNGTVPVALSATGSETTTGGGTVVAAEYRIDTTAGAGVAMASNGPATTVALTASIPAATVAALANGVHTVYVRSQDDLLQWGADASATLTKGTTGPATTAVAVGPSPNSGSLSWWSSPGYIRVSATMTSSTVNVVDAEGFIDTVGANGSGFHLLASDGVFNSPSEAGYASVPLSQLQTLSNGNHTISVHGKDAAGNWGPMGTAILVIDRGNPPTVSGLAASPNPTDGAPSVTLTATATDAATSASAIASAEWFEGLDPGLGLGTAMTATDGTFNSSTEAIKVVIPVATWTFGNHILGVRAMDASGNWSAIATVTVNVRPANAIFSDGFETGNFANWNGTVGAPSVTAAAAMTGTRGMQVTVAGANTPTYAIDNSPTNEPTYHASFQFRPNTLVTNANAVDIFTGRNAAVAPLTLFRVQYRTTGLGNSTRQVRAVVRGPAGDTTGAWFTITNAVHTLRIDWLSATAGSAVVSVDGTVRSTANANTSNATYLVDTVWLGLSAGLGNGRTGTAYFDTFVSTRRTLP